MSRLRLLSLQNLAPGVDPADGRNGAEVDFLDAETPCTGVQDDASPVISSRCSPAPLSRKSEVVTVAVGAWSARLDRWALAGRLGRSGWRGWLALRRGIDVGC